MDQESRFWRRKASDKSSGETDSIASSSSHSERSSDDQDLLTAPHGNLSLHPLPQQALSEDAVCELQETVKFLSKKLSGARRSLKAKEDMVKQHAKVAEEAVSGLEQAEIKTLVLKQQLEALNQKNSALEDKVILLDGALKDNGRQHDHSKGEQGQEFHEALQEKTCEWESQRHHLECRLAELQACLDAEKVDGVSRVELQLKLKVTNEENSKLRAELHHLSDNFRILALERDLSTNAAETASKQLLEATRKVTKLEAECRVLQATISRKLDSNRSSICMESVGESLSSSGERFQGVEGDQRCLDSWASALVMELDQFKNDNAGVRDFTNSSPDIDLMDDFLEMERIAALSMPRDSSSSIEPRCDVDQVGSHSTSSAEEKIEAMTRENAELEMVLGETRNQLDISKRQLIVAEEKLVECQMQLDAAITSRNSMAKEMQAKQTDKKALQDLNEKVALLEKKVEDEMSLSAELSAKCQVLENKEAERQVLESQLESARSEVGKLRKQLISSERDAELHKALSIEFEAKCQVLDVVESYTKVQESQLKAAESDIGELRDKLQLLEGELEEEKGVSAAYKASVGVEKAKLKQMEAELLSVCAEVAKAQERAACLEAKLKEEMVFSAEVSGKCTILEDELSRKKQESELKLSSSNGGLKIRQEELVAAAGKLAECQKTIASLSIQLQSLTCSDDVATAGPESITTTTTG